MREREKEMERVRERWQRGENTGKCVNETKERRYVKELVTT